MGNLISDFLSSMMTQSPFILACMVGILLGMINWGKHPGPSMMAVIGSLILLGSVVIGTFIRMYVGREYVGENGAIIYRLLSFVTNIADGGGLVLILLGVFSGRSRPSARVDDVMEVSRM